MDPLIVAGSAIAILREALAEIQAAVKRGEIPVDAQEAQLRKIDMLRVGQFEGPEWQVAPDARPEPPRPNGA